MCSLARHKRRLHCPQLLGLILNPNIFQVEKKSSRKPKKGWIATEAKKTANEVGFHTESFACYSKADISREHVGAHFPRLACK